jgi:hypothetical protein
VAQKGTHGYQRERTTNEVAFCAPVGTGGPRFTVPCANGLRAERLGTKPAGR